MHIDDTQSTGDEGVRVFRLPLVLSRCCPPHGHGDSHRVQGWTSGLPVKAKNTFYVYLPQEIILCC